MYLNCVDMGDIQRLWNMKMIVFHEINHKIIRDTRIGVSSSRYVRTLGSVVYCRKLILLTSQNKISVEVVSAGLLN